jgi:hypothetical protein
VVEFIEIIEIISKPSSGKILRKDPGTPQTQHAVAGGAGQA